MVLSDSDDKPECFWKPHLKSTFDPKRSFSSGYRATKLGSKGLQLANLMTHAWPMNIDIPKQLADKLQAIADKQSSTPEAVLTQLLTEYESLTDEQAGSFAALAKSAMLAGIHGDEPVDTAARSREILTAEYSDYLKRQNRDQDGSVD
jgi:hypothetical protein